MTNPIARLLAHFHSDGPNNWRDIEYFNRKWKIRIRKMSEFIEPDCSVVDLGCGRMWLKNYLPQTVKYFPVDYKYRGADCIVQDFNQLQYPDVDADTAFVSGCLEYIDEPRWFVSEICRNQTMCVLSYCTTEYFPDEMVRMKKAWVNSLSETQVISLFKDFGFALTHKTHEKTYVIFVFRKLVPEDRID